MIIGYDPRKILFSRIKLIHKRVVSVYPEWINTIISKGIEKRMNRVEDQFSKCFVTSFDNINTAYMEKRFTPLGEIAKGSNIAHHSSESEINGKQVIVSNRKYLLKNWQSINELYNLLWSTRIWGKKCQLALCKAHNVPWGSDDIDTCCLLNDYLHTNLDKHVSNEE